MTAPSLPAAPGFGETLRRLRESRRRSQGNLAHRAGLDATSISRLERGERGPSRETVCRLADALFCDRAEKDALLAAAGYVPVDGLALAGEPELAALEGCSR